MFSYYEPLNYAFAVIIICCTELLNIAIFIVRYLMFAVGGGFKLLSAVAFFFAWKFYELPATESSNGDSIPDTTSQTTIVDGSTQKEHKDITELSPVAQLITVSNPKDSDKQEKPKITCV